MSLNEKDVLTQIAQFFAQQIPFNQHLNMRALHVSDGKCEVLCPWSPTLIGNMHRNTVHGGVIATMIDAAAGAALFTKLTPGSDSISTIDLRVDFLEPAYPGDLRAAGSVIKIGSTIAHTLVEVDSKLPSGEFKRVAIGHAVFHIRRGK